MTEFEKWWTDEWWSLVDAVEGHPRRAHEARVRSLVGDDWHLLATTIVPSESISYPPAGKREPDDHSWDRRAAWLVYSRLRSEGKTLNEASDLFG